MSGHPALGAAGLGSVGCTVNSSPVNIRGTSSGVEESCWSKCLSSCCLWDFRGKIFPLFPFPVFCIQHRVQTFLQICLKPPVSSQELGTPQISEPRLPPVQQLFGTHLGHTQRWWQLLFLQHSTTPAIHQDDNHFYHTHHLCVIKTSLIVVLF